MGESPELLASQIRLELNKLEELVNSFNAEVLPLLSLSDDEVTVLHKGGTGYYIHNFYNGLENIFSAIARFYENDLSRDSWHRDLLTRMLLSIKNYRPAVIDRELFTELEEYRSFRHVYRHIYGFELKWQRERDLAEKLPAVYKNALRQINSFLEKIEP